MRRFSSKAHEQTAANKKIYCVDNGLAMAMGFHSSPDDGRLLETLVAIALRKRELNHVARIYFWRNAQNEEVDFVVREGAKTTELIQVCFDLSNPKTRTREVRALLKAGAELKCRNLLLLNAVTEKEERAEWFGLRGSIRYLPARKWLLDQQ